MVDTATRQLDHFKDVATGIANDLGNALPSVVRDLPSSVRDLPDVAISHSPFASKKRRSKARRLGKPAVVILVVATVAGLVKFWPRKSSPSPTYASDGEAERVSR